MIIQWMSRNKIEKFSQQVKIHRTPLTKTQAKLLEKFRCFLVNTEAGALYLESDSAAKTSVVFLSKLVLIQIASCDSEDRRCAFMHL